MSDGKGKEEECGMRPGVNHFVWGAVLLAVCFSQGVFGETTANTPPDSDWWTWVLHVHKKDPQTMLGVALIAYSFIFLWNFILTEKQIREAVC